MVDSLHGLDDLILAKRDDPHHAMQARISLSQAWERVGVRAICCSKSACSLGYLLVGCNESCKGMTRCAPYILAVILSRAKDLQLAFLWETVGVRVF